MVSHNTRDKSYSHASKGTADTCGAAQAADQGPLFILFSLMRMAVTMLSPELAH